MSREMFGWWEGQMLKKEEWRYAGTMSGVQSAMMAGMMMMTTTLLLYVSSWGCKVSLVKK